MLNFVVVEKLFQEELARLSSSAIKVRLFVRASWWYNSYRRYHGEPGPRIKADDITESNEKGHGANQHSDHLIRGYHPLLIQLFNHHHPLSLPLQRGGGEKKWQFTHTWEHYWRYDTEHSLLDVLSHGYIVWRRQEYFFADLRDLFHIVFFKLSFQVSNICMYKKIMTKVCYNRLL